jgi:hypothetical protein
MQLQFFCITKKLKIIRPILLILPVALFVLSGCATDRKAREIIKRADSSCDLSHLGRNKLYYSPSYKRYLDNNISHIKRNRTSSMKIVKVRRY